MTRFLCILLLLGASAAEARPMASANLLAGQVASEAPAPPAATIVRDGISLADAVRQVRRQYGGQILSAETRGSGDQRVHVIKVLTKDGRVRTVRIRAN